MRVNGRTLRPSTLAERRLLLSLGVRFLRVPRSENPFHVARRLRRAASGEGPDLDHLRGLVRLAKQHEYTPSPELDLPRPRRELVDFPSV